MKIIKVKERFVDCIYPDPERNKTEELGSYTITLKEPDYVKPKKEKKRYSLRDGSLDELGRNTTELNN